MLLLHFSTTASALDKPSTDESTSSSRAVTGAGISRGGVNDTHSRIRYIKRLRIVLGICEMVDAGDVDDLWYDLDRERRHNDRLRRPFFSAITDHRRIAGDNATVVDVVRTLHFTLELEAQGDSQSGFCLRSVAHIHRGRCPLDENA